MFKINYFEVSISGSSDQAPAHEDDDGNQDKRSFSNSIQDLSSVHLNIPKRPRTSNINLYSSDICEFPSTNSHVSQHHKESAHESIRYLGDLREFASSGHLNHHKKYQHQVSR